MDTASLGSPLIRSWTEAMNGKGRAVERGAEKGTLRGHNLEWQHGTGLGQRPTVQGAQEHGQL
eukprot:4473836-Pyramimonas_sp.AAC.1